jgi:hypothetical protein
MKGKKKVENQLAEMGARLVNVAWRMKKKKRMSAAVPHAAGQISQWIAAAVKVPLLRPASCVNMTQHPNMADARRLLCPRL